MKKNLFIAIFFSILSVNGIAQEADNSVLKSLPNPTPAPIDEPVIPDHQKDRYMIHEINQHKFTAGAFMIEAYVNQVDKCDCPKGAECDPCPPPNMIISEVIKAPVTFPLTKNEVVEVPFTDQDMIVHINRSDNYEVGARYKFLIQIIDVKTFSQAPINDVKIVYSEKFDVAK